MENVEINAQEIKNSDSPFTELFALLIPVDERTENFLTLTNDANQLLAAYTHAENAIEVLLKGIHDLGQLISKAPASINVELINFGLLVSYLANLVEALNLLHSNILYILEKRRNVLI